MNGTAVLTAPTTGKKIVGKKIVADENAINRGDVKLMDYSHRCDRCGARAYLKAYETGEMDEDRHLLFCAHHGRALEASLREKGFNTEDQTIMLYKVAKLDVSA